MTELDIKAAAVPNGATGIRESGGCIDWGGCGSRTRSTKAVFGKVGFFLSGARVATKSDYSYRGTLSAPLE